MRTSKKNRSLQVFSVTNPRYGITKPVTVKAFTRWLAGAQVGVNTGKIRRGKARYDFIHSSSYRIVK